MWILILHFFLCLLSLYSSWEVTKNISFITKYCNVQVTCTSTICFGLGLGGVGFLVFWVLFWFCFFNSFSEWRVSFQWKHLTPVKLNVLHESAWQPCPVELWASGEASIHLASQQPACNHWYLSRGDCLVLHPCCTIHTAQVTKIPRSCRSLMISLQMCFTLSVTWKNVYLRKWC